MGSIEPTGPTYSTYRKLWARMVAGLSWLERLIGAGISDSPDMPDLDYRLIANLFAMLCHAEIRERVLVALAPGIRAIVRDELRRMERAA